MEALLEFTSQARRRIAVRRHLKERLGGLSVKWGGPPPPPSKHLSAAVAVSGGGKIKAFLFHVELMGFTETPLLGIAVDVG